MTDELPDLPRTTSAPPEKHTAITDLLWVGDHESVVLNCHADPEWAAMLMRDGQVVSVNDAAAALAVLIAYGIGPEDAQTMVDKALTADHG